MHGTGTAQATVEEMKAEAAAEAEYDAAPAEAAAEADHDAAPAETRQEAAEAPAAGNAAVTMETPAAAPAAGNAAAGMEAPAGTSAYEEKAAARKAAPAAAEMARADEAEEAAQPDMADGGFRDEAAAGRAAETTMAAMIANPFRECESLSEAADIAGFPLEVPETVGSFEMSVIRVMDVRMIEVIYLDAKGREGLRIRKGPGNEDISGDYTEWPYTWEMEEDGANVTVRSDDGEKAFARAAVWTRDGFSYSVTADGKVLDEAALREIVKESR